MGTLSKDWQIRLPWSFLALAVVLANASAYASSPPPKKNTPQPPKPVGRVWIHVRTETPATQWKARAIEEAVAQNLATSDRIVLVDSIQSKSLTSENSCEPEQLDCMLRALRFKNIDIWILGTIEKEDRKLHLRSFETWTRSLVGETELSFGDQTSLSDFRHRAFRLIKPFVELGGLLDQHQAGLSYTKPQPRAVESAREEQSLMKLIAAMVLLGLLFWLPPVLLSGIDPGKTVKRWIYSMSALLPLSFFSAAYFLAHEKAGAFQMMKYLLGGAGWASVLVVAHRFVLPSLRGLDRVNFFTIFALLRAWTAVAIFKAALIVLALLPFLKVGLGLAEFLELGRVSSWMIIAPFSILTGYVWYLVWLAYLTRYIDSRLVSENETERRRWNSEIRKYFRGYVNRLGVDIHERLFERTQFFPGNADPVVSYGGGLVAPRVVLSSSMLIYAMGALPEQDKDETTETSFADYEAGRIVPRKKSSSAFTDEIQISRFPWNFFQKKAKAPERKLQAGPAFNLHGATALGYMIPSPQETEALAANSREDFNALAELLTAHYSQFSKEQEDQEFDDTDPTDKDFLFGALLREQGVIEQRNQLLSTVSLALTLAHPYFPSLITKGIDGLRRLYAMTFSKYPDLVADAYAALNFGRNHLAQYLSYLFTDTRGNLTARANKSTLYGISRQIIRDAEITEPSREDLQPFRSTVRNRLIWLSEFFYGSVKGPSERIIRQISILTAALLFIAVAGAFLEDSYTYHSVYQARMERMKQKIQKQEEERQQRIQEQSNGRK